MLFLCFSVWFNKCIICFTLFLENIYYTVIVMV